MLLSPHLFRVEVSGRAIAPPVRRCITHLLPVRPTNVGRTNLTSQGAPMSVTRGEPCKVERKNATDELTPNAVGTTPPAFGVFAYISWESAYPRIGREISGLGEIIRGPVVTLWVSIGPRTSRGKTLALSRRDSKRVNHTVTTTPRTNLRSPHNSVNIVLHLKPSAGNFTSRQVGSEAWTIASEDTLPKPLVLGLSSLLALRSRNSRLDPALLLAHDEPPVEAGCTMQAAGTRNNS
jgi:hypothetical protein